MNLAEPIVLLMSSMARKKFTTSLDENIIQQLKIQAVKEGTDASKILEKLIEEYLKKQA
ncbi:hypothetical protein [Niallia endozanthoxylica]|nr:hypothetical protein [Niallia endozanthoxylica]